MIRRTWSGRLIALLALSVLESTAATAAPPCPISPPSSEVNIPLIAFRATVTEYLTQQMRACNDVHNISVDPKLVGWSQLMEQTNIVTQSGGTSPFDVLHSYNAKLPELVHRGALLPLDAYFKKYAAQYNLNDISSEALSTVTYDGKIMGFPFQVNTMILFYRKDLFAKYGIKVPTNLDEWLSAAEKLKSASEIKYPLALSMGGAAGSGAQFHNALMAYGGQWFDAKGKPSFNSAAGVKAIDTLRKLMSYAPPSGMSFTENDVMVAMQQGIVGTTVIWVTRAGNMNDPKVSQVVDKVGFAKAPAGPAGLFSGRTEDVWLIPKNAKNPDVAFQVIAQSMTEDKVRAAAKLFISPRKSVSDDKALAASIDWLAPANATLAASRSLPNLPYALAVRDAVGDTVNKELLDSSVSSQKLLADADAAANRVMRDQGYAK